MVKTLALCVVELVALGCVGCGGSSSSAASQCKMDNAAICSKVFTCNEAASFRDTYGSNQADCMTTMDAFCNPNGCPPGMTFRADIATQCISATQAVTCAQIGSGGELALFPPVCDSVCN